MGIIFTKDINGVERSGLDDLYGNKFDSYSLFENSLIRVFAIEDGRVVGAVRGISEGVETDLLVDLKVFGEFDAETAKSIKVGLIREAEKDIRDRRVMVYGSRKDLELYEELGYGRCKNAWTYFREGMEESDFLPAGYRFENEFISPSAPRFSTSGKEKEDPVREIIYRSGYEETGFEDINTVLTKAFGGRPHDVNKTGEAFSNSRYSITAYDDKKLVGVARAVSDGKKYATILNVAVDPEYQGLAIGKNIVLKLSEIIEAEVIVLNTHPGAVGFYNKLKEYRRNKYVLEKFIRNDDVQEKDISRGIGENIEKSEESRINDKKQADWTAAMFTPKGYRFPDEY